jgi:hypothetical protein
MHVARGRRLWILLAVAAVLVIVAVLAIVASLAMRQRQPDSLAWQDPLTAVDPGGVVPQLALYPLAGASELETIDAGIDNGDLMTAYSTLAYSSDVSDKQRIGRLAALGDQFAQADDPSMASVAFGQVYDLALLSPRLNDPLRVDALRQAARGWAGMGEKSRALGALGQVQVIASSSPYLRTSQRREMLASLEAAYRDLDEGGLAEQVRAQIVALDQGSPAVPADTLVRPAELPSAGDAVSSQEVGSLEEARRQAAYAVIDSLSAGSEPTPEQLSQLDAALKAEDAAKLSLYRQELDATTQPGRRMAIHQLLVRWLLLKYRIAQKGFGLSIVQDWEVQVGDIQSDLSKAHEDLLFDREDWAASLPDASYMAPSSYAALRLALMSGRLGQYPNYPVEQLAQNLQATVSEMVGAGHAAELFVALRDSGGELQPQLELGADYAQDQAP